MIVIPGQPNTWLTVGWLIALVILIVMIVLLVISAVPLMEGLLIGGLALARLL